jgi:hypothetical protein
VTQGWTRQDLVAARVGGDKAKLPQEFLQVAHKAWSIDDDVQAAEALRSCRNEAAPAEGVEAGSGNPRRVGGVAVVVEETFACSRLVRIGSRGQQEGSRKMRSNRRKNWFIKRIALGLAIAAVAAPVAQAKVDEGSSVQANSYQAFATDFPSYANVVNASDYGMPRPTATDYAISRGDLIEVVRSTPNGTASDKIEFVRTTQPRSTGEPQVVSAGFDWKDAGIGAGLALALVLLGGGAVLATRQLGRAQTA